MKIKIRKYKYFLEKKSMRINRTLIITAIISILIFPNLVQAQTGELTISKEILFHLSAYDTYFSFSDDITANKVEPFDNEVFFYDIKMGTGPTTHRTSFAVENTDMTITNLFTDLQLILNLETPSGMTSQVKGKKALKTLSGMTSQVRVYWPSRSSPEEVECTGCTEYDWEFNSTTRIVTLDATHTTPVTWTLLVQLPTTTTPPNGGGGGGGGMPPMFDVIGLFIGLGQPIVIITVLVIIVVIFGVLEFVAKKK